MGISRAHLAAIGCKGLVELIYEQNHAYYTGAVEQVRKHRQHIACHSVVW